MQYGKLKLSVCLFDGVIQLMKTVSWNQFLLVQASLKKCSFNLNLTLEQTMVLLSQCYKLAILSGKDPGQAIIRDFIITFTRPVQNSEHAEDGTQAIRDFMAKRGFVWNSHFWLIIFLVCLPLKTHTGVEKQDSTKNVKCWSPTHKTM